MSTQLKRVARKLTADEVLKQIIKRTKSHQHYPFNPCYLRKIDVQRGAIIKNIGRSQPAGGTLWTVLRITTDLGPGYQKKDIAEVIRYTDQVRLRCLSTGEIRDISFSQLCYSSTWWYESSSITELKKGAQ